MLCINKFMKRSRVVGLTDESVLISFFTAEARALIAAFNRWILTRFEYGGRSDFSRE